MNPEQDTAETFFSELASSLSDGTFVELLLTKHHGAEKDLRRVLVRRVALQEEPHLSFVARYETRDITTSCPVASRSDLAS